MAREDRVEEYNKKILGEFGLWLENKGWTQKTIETHLENVDIYAHLYLQEYEPTQIGEVKNNMDSFFFFLHEKLSPSSSFLNKMRASMRKFFTFLNERGLFTKEEREEVFASLKKLQSPTASTVQQRASLDWEVVWEDFLIDKDRYYNYVPLPQPEVEIVSDYQKNLQTAVDNPFLQDIQFLLQWIDRSHPTITMAKRYLARKHLAEISTQLIQSHSILPEKLPKNANEEDYPYLFFLGAMIRGSGLVIPITRTTLGLTDRGEAFLKIPPPSQLGLLFHVFWNHLHWEICNPTYLVDDMIHLKHLLYQILSKFPAKLDIHLNVIYEALEEEESRIHQIWPKNKSMHHVFYSSMDTIMRPMEYCNVLTCKRKNELPISFRMYPLGEKLFQVVTCKERTIREEDSFCDDFF